METAEYTELGRRLLDAAQSAAKRGAWRIYDDLIVHEASGHNIDSAAVQYESTHNDDFDDGEGIGLEDSSDDTGVKKSARELPTGKLRHSRDSIVLTKCVKLYRCSACILCDFRKR